MLDRIAASGRTQATDIRVGCEQFERAIEPRASLKQKRKIERKNRDVFRSNTLFKLEIEVRCAR